MSEEINLENTLKFLQSQQPGFLEPALFYELCRLITMPIVDVVPLAIRDDQIHVLLTKRDDSDPFFSGKLHIPGTIIRSSDQKGTLDDAFNRVLNGELEGTRILTKPTAAGYSFHQSARGPELSLVHYVLVDSNTPGTLVEVNNLPENIIPHQIEIIKQAVQHYKDSIEL